MGNQRICWARKFLRITNTKDRIKIQNDVCIIEKRLDIHRSYTFQNFRKEITDFEKIINLENVYEIVKPKKQGFLGQREPSQWILRAPGYMMTEREQLPGHRIG